MTNWSFLTDDEFISNLAELWKTIVDPNQLSNDEFNQALEMLQQIASAKTGFGSWIQSHYLTAKALPLKTVVERFREKQKAAETGTQELNAFDEAEKAIVSKANGSDLTKAEQQAMEWYDNVEKALLGLVKRIQTDETNAFVGGDDGMFMRRLVGAGGMMAITSPSIPVKQNMLMTMIGIVVAENALKEVFEEYVKEQGNENKTFMQFVEDIVQTQNSEHFRKFLNKVEERIFVGSETKKEATQETKGTSFWVKGIEQLKEEGVTAEKEITPLPFVEGEEGGKVTAKLKLGENQDITVVMENKKLSNLQKGILIYLDALATPEFSNIDPATKKPSVITKWTYQNFVDFYENTQKAIETANLSESAKQQLAELMTSFFDRERRLRYGTKPSKKAKKVKTAPIGEQSVFGNAIRDYYITHFGAEATKVKSFGLSVVFNTIADKLGLGSSVLPSVVYDVWINANIHNLLREAEEDVNKTGMPNNDRLTALQQKYRQALLPYGFDVAFSFDETTKRVNVVVKDFETGKVYQRKTRRISVYNMKDEDSNVFTAITNSPTLRKIREEWKQKRMFFASKQTEVLPEKAQRLTNLTKVLLRRGRTEWHSVFQAGAETAGALVLKELENAVNHFMNIRYDQEGNVYILPSHPFYQKIQGLEKTQNLKNLFDGTKEVSIETIYQVGKNETVNVVSKTIQQPKPLWELYKNYIDTLREGGVPMAFSEQILKNALYIDPTKPMEPRKLQALLWVCTRGAL